MDGHSGKLSLLARGTRQGSRRGTRRNARHVLSLLGLVALVAIVSACDGGIDLSPPALPSGYTASGGFLYGAHPSDPASTYAAAPATQSVVSEGADAQVINTLFTPTVTAGTTNLCTGSQAGASADYGQNAVPVALIRSFVERNGVYYFPDSNTASVWRYDPNRADNCATSPSTARATVFATGLGGAISSVTSDGSYLYAARGSALYSIPLPATEPGPTDAVPTASAGTVGMTVSGAMGLAVVTQGSVKKLVVAAGTRVYICTLSGGACVTGTATTVSGFTAAYGVTGDSQGRIYVTDSTGHRVYRITEASGATPASLTSVFGTGAAGSSTTGCSTTLASATASNPKGIAADSSDNLWVSSDNCIRNLVMSSGSVSSIGGAIGTWGTGFANSGTVKFNAIAALRFDGSGNLLIADAGNGRLRKMTTSGASSSWAVSTSLRFAYPDHWQPTGANAVLPAVYGVAVSGANTYVLDKTWRVLLRVNGGRTSTVAAALTSTSSSLAASATCSPGAQCSNSVDLRLNTPRGLAVVPGTDELYFADSSTPRLYRVTSATSSPSLAMVASLGSSGAPVSVAADATSVFVGPDGSATTSIGKYARSASATALSGSAGFVTVPWTVQGLAITGSGTKLAIATSAGLYSVSTSGGTPALVGGTGGGFENNYPALAAGDDGKLYAGDTSGTVTGVDVSTATPTKWAPPRLSGYASTIAHAIAGTAYVRADANGVFSATVAQTDLAVTRVGVTNSLYPNNNSYADALPTSIGQVPVGPTDNIPEATLTGGGTGTGYTASCSYYNAGSNCSALSDSYAFGNSSSYMNGGVVDVDVSVANQAAVGSVNVAVTLDSTKPVLRRAAMLGYSLTLPTPTVADATQTWTFTNVAFTDAMDASFTSGTATVTLYFDYPTEAKAAITATATVSGGLVGNLNGANPSAANDTLSSGAVTMASFWDLRAELKQVVGGVTGDPLSGNRVLQTPTFALQFSNRGPAAMPAGFTTRTPIPTGTVLTKVSQSGVDCTVGATEMVCTGSALSVGTWQSGGPTVIFTVAWPGLAANISTVSLNTTVDALSSGEAYQAGAVDAVSGQGVGRLTGDRKHWTQDFDPVLYGKATQADTTRTLKVLKSSVQAVVGVNNAFFGAQDKQIDIGLSNPDSGSGSASSAPVSVEVTFPTGTTFVSGGGSGYTCSGVTNVVTCTSPTALAANASLSVPVVVNLPVDAPSAAVTPRFLSGVDYGEGTSTPGAIGRQADMGITANAPGSPLVAGVNNTFTATVTNNGPSATATAFVVWSLPTGVTYRAAGNALPSGWSCVDLYGLGTLIDCSSNATVAVNASATLTIGVTVASSAATNSATVTASTGSYYSSCYYYCPHGTSLAPDLNAANDSYAWTGSIAQSADLSVAGISGSLIAGTTQSLSVLVRNNTSTYAATSPSVTVLVPTGLTIVSGSGGSFTCTPDGTGSSATCTATTFAAAATPPASKTITLSVRAASSVQGLQAITATITSATADPDATNNSLTTSLGAGANQIAVVATSDLSVTGVAPASALAASVPNTLAVGITNIGPADATSPSVVVQLPTTMDYRAAGNSLADGWGCAAGGTGNRTITCSGPTLGAGVSLGWSIGVTAGATATASTTVTATVSTTTTDSVSANNTMTWTGAIAQSADLGLALTTSNSLFEGATATFTVTVSNAGASAATSPSVELALPTGLSFVSGGASGFTCANGVTVTCTISGTLAANTSRSTTITVAIANGALGSATATGAVTSTTPDPTPANNSATAVATVGPTANVSVNYGSANPYLPASGDWRDWRDFVAGEDNAVYFDVYNTGPSTATSLQLTYDFAGTELTYRPVGNRLPAGWSCSASGTVVQCSGSSLVKFATAHVELGVAVPSSPTTYVIDGHPTWNGFGEGTGYVWAAEYDPNGLGNVIGGGDDPYFLVAWATDLSATVANGGIAAGNPTTYTATVTNAGPSTADAATVTASLPPNLSYKTGSVGGPFTCSASGAGLRTVSCTGTGTIAPGAEQTLEFRADVAPAATGTLCASFAVLQDAHEANNVLANNADSVCSTVGVAADLGVSISGATLRQTADSSFTVTVTNVGPADALDVVATVTTSEGVTVDAASSGGSGFTCSATDTGASCTRGTLSGPSGGVAGSASFTLVLSVAPDAAATATTSVAVAGSTVDLIPGNNIATDAARTVVATADLVVTGVAPSSPLGASAPNALVVGLENLSPTAAATPSVVMTLPTSLTYRAAGNVLPAGWSCSAGGVGNRTVTCTGASLAGHATTELAVGVTAGATSVPSLTATAVVSAATTDLVAANNTLGWTGSIAESADLALTLTATDSFVEGSTAAVSVRVTNNGAYTASDASVVVPLPTGVTFDHGGRAGFACVAADATVTCTPSGALASGTTATTSIAVAIAPGALGSVAIAGVVTSATLDPTVANNTSSITPTVAAAADLSASVSGSDPVTRGSTARYTVGVANSGPSAAPNTTITVTLGSGFSVTSAPDCSVVSSVVTCDGGSVAADGSAQRSIDLAVAQTGTIGSVCVATASSAVDLNAANSSACTTPSVISVTDLGVGVATGGFAAGFPATVTLTATNHGPSPAEGATLRVSLPDGVTYDHSASENGYTCGAAGPDVTCVAARPMLADASTSVIVHVNVDAAVTTDVEVQASVDRDANEADATIADNTAAPLVVTPGVAVDLGVDVALTSADLRQGQDATYLATLTNAGPANAGGVIVTIVLPVGLTYASLGSPANGVTCQASGDGRTVTCRRASLALGATVTFPFAVHVGAAASGALHVAATIVSDTTNLVDVVQGNDTATSADVVVTPVADLAVGYRAPATLYQATTATYTATVANLGPSAAAGPVTLSVALPVGLTFHADGSGASGWSCSAGAVTGSGQTVTCTHASDLAVTVGDSLEVPIVVDVAADATDALTPRMTIASATLDLIAANNTATHAGVVPTTSADLAVVLERTGTPTVGSTVTYTATVANNSPMSAASVSLTIHLPTGMTVHQSGGFAGDFSCSGTSTVACTRSSLGASPTTALATILVDVGSNVGTTAEVDASVSATTHDPNPSNNSDEDSVAVVRAANLSVSIAAGQIVGGSTTAITMTVTNAGPSPAVSPSVALTLPTGMTYSSASGASCSAAGAVVTCAISSPMTVGDPTTVTVTASNVPTLSGSVTIAAVTSSSTSDPVAGNNTASVTRVATAPATLAVSAQATTPLVMGAEGTVRVTVANTGPGAAEDVNVALNLPSGVGAVFDIRARGRSASSVTIPFGTIASGITVQRDVVLAVADNLPADTVFGLAVSTASPLSASAPTATLSAPLTRVSDVSLDTAVGDATLGAPLALTFGVHNDGPSTMPAPVIVRVTLSSDLQNPTARGDGWTCAFAAPVMTCTYASAVAPNQDATFTIAGTLASLADLANLAVASIETTGVTDPSATNNRSVTSLTTAVVNVSRTPIAASGSAGGGAVSEGSEGAAASGAPTGVPSGSGNATPPAAARVRDHGSSQSSGYQGWAIGVVLVLFAVSLLFMRRRHAVG